MRNSFVRLKKSLFKESYDYEGWGRGLERNDEYNERWSFEHSCCEPNGLFGGGFTHSSSPRLNAFTGVVQFTLMSVLAPMLE